MRLLPLKTPSNSVNSEPVIIDTGAEYANYCMHHGGRRVRVRKVQMPEKTWDGERLKTEDRRPSQLFKGREEEKKGRG